MIAPRRATAILAVKACWAVLAVSVGAPTASAAEQQIVAATNAETFSPAEVTVGIGDTVTVSRAAGGTFAHNSHYDDLPNGCPPSPTTSAWSCPRTFASAGDFTFRCDLHLAMQATVHVVSGGGAPGPTPISPSPGAPGANPQASRRVVPVERLASLPPAGPCLAPGPLRFRLKRPAGTAAVAGRVFVDGKRVARRGRASLTTPILVRLPAEKRVKIRVEVVTEDGSRLAGSRRYRICTQS